MPFLRFFPNRISHFVEHRLQVERRGAQRKYVVKNVGESAFDFR